MPILVDLKKKISIAACGGYHTIAHTGDLLIKKLPTIKKMTDKRIVGE